MIRLIGIAPCPIGIAASLPQSVNGWIPLSAAASLDESFDCDPYGNTLPFTAPGTELRQEPRSRHGEGSPLREFTDDDLQSSYGANEIIYCGYPDNDRQSEDIGTGRFDFETQLYYVRNRIYNQSLGRWGQKGLTEYEDGMNGYQLEESDPVNAPDRHRLAWMASREGLLAAATQPASAKCTVKGKDYNLSTKFKHVIRVSNGRFSWSTVVVIHP